jgi:hypothetical protein
MTSRIKNAILALAAMAAFSAWMGPRGAAASSAAEGGALHITKSCASFTGAAGGFCTITTSNVPAIKPGAKVYYDQGFGIPAGMLDANVVLSVAQGDWATGRCTLDGSTGQGICQFTDGVGQLAGFRARIKVSPFPDGVDYHWDGTYSFGSDFDR